MNSVRKCLLVAALAVAVACESDPTMPPFVVTEVEVDPATANLVVGDTVRLTAHPRTSDGQILGSSQVAWTSESSEHATVVPAGLVGRVTATRAGTVRITATVNGHTGQATLTITEKPAPGPVTMVEISVDSAALEEGEATQLSATARDADGTVVTGRVVQWTSASPAIAAIDPLGQVTGVRVGATDIQARVDGVTASIPVRVWGDFEFDLVYGAWDGADGKTNRPYQVDMADAEPAPVRIGPDAAIGNVKPSPDGGRIAYVASTGTGLRGIYTADTDGSDIRELLRTSDDTCGFLAWRPDGARLAFACRIDGDDLDIWVMDAADGGNRTNLTDGHPHNQDWPTWSPQQTDGSYRIAYAQYVGSEPRIYVMNDDGSEPTELTSGMDWQPDWSADGSSIAFVRTTAAAMADVHVVDVATGVVRGSPAMGLAGPQWSPTWSPDGRLIAFSSSHATYASAESVTQIYTVWADFTKLAVRTSGTLQKHNPAWRVR